MRIEDVRYILRVANEQNLTRAAAIEHVSVPAMSEAIRRMEKMLGVRLFDRSHRGMRLTPDGRSLHPQLRELAAAATALQYRAGALSEGVDAVRVGTLFGYGSVALDHLGQLDGDHRPSRPIEIGVYDWTDPTAGLRTGETDLAILIGPTEIDSELESRVLGTEVRVAVVSRHHRLGARASVVLDDLDRAGWLSIDVGDPVWRSFWTADAQRGGPPPRSGRSPCHSPEEVAIALRRGHGVVISLREIADRYSVGHDTCVPIEDVPPVPIRLVHRPDADRAVVEAVFEGLSGRLPTPAGTPAILSRARRKTP